MAEVDIAEKTLEAYNDVFADIINVLLFGGKQVVHKDELENAVARSAYKVDGKLREQERDVAKYWKNQMLRVAFLGMENQTSPDDDMPLRIYGYDGAAYRNQIYSEVDESGKRRPNKNPRYPVITLVLYFGTKRWNKAKTLYEALGDQLADELKPYVNDLSINLFEIAFLTDEQVHLFRSDFKIVADYFTQIRKNEDYDPPEELVYHVQEVMQLLFVLTGNPEYEAAANDPEIGKEVRTMKDWLDRTKEREYQRGEKAGFLNGEKAGFLNGEKAKATKTARWMKDHGFSYDDIASAVDESKDTVFQLLGMENALA